MPEEIYNVIIWVLDAKVGTKMAECSLPFSSMYTQIKYAFFNKNPVKQT